jgi:hypothetical protein
MRRDAGLQRIGAPCDVERLGECVTRDQRGGEQREGLAIARRPQRERRRASASARA